MKFSEMPYSRPDLEQIKSSMAGFNDRLAKSQSYDQAKKVFLECENFKKHLYTLSTLAHTRNTIDTRDTFYDEEMKFWSGAEPEIQEYEQLFR